MSQVKSGKERQVRFAEDPPETFVYNPAPTYSYNTGSSWLQPSQVYPTASSYSSPRRSASPSPSRDYGLGSRDYGGNSRGYGISRSSHSTSSLYSPVSTPFSSSRYGSHGSSVYRSASIATPREYSSPSRYYSDYFGSVGRYGAGNSPSPSLSRSRASSASVIERRSSYGGSTGRQSSTSYLSSSYSSPTRSSGLTASYRPSRSPQRAFTSPMPSYSSTLSHPAVTYTSKFTPAYGTAQRYIYYPNYPTRTTGLDYKYPTSSTSFTTSTPSSTQYTSYTPSYQSDKSYRSKSHRRYEPEKVKTPGFGEWYQDYRVQWRTPHRSMRFQK